jgi:hypothetical protein
MYSNAMVNIIFTRKSSVSISVQDDLKPFSSCYILVIPSCEICNKRITSKKIPHKEHNPLKIYSKTCKLEKTNWKEGSNRQPIYLIPFLPTLSVWIVF